MAAAAPPLLTGRIKRPRRYRAGTVALREIARYQKSTETGIPKATFVRLVKSKVQRMPPHYHLTRINATALKALQEATENYVIQFFEDLQILAFRAGRITLDYGDVYVLNRLRRDPIVNYFRDFNIRSLKSKFRPAIPNP